MKEATDTHLQFQEISLIPDFILIFPGMFKNMELDLCKIINFEKFLLWWKSEKKWAWR